MLFLYFNWENYFFYKEKSKLRSKFLKSNKLNPYDDKTDFDSANRNRDPTSWAIVDHQGNLKKQAQLL